MQNAENSSRVPEKVCTDAGDWLWDSETQTLWLVELVLKILARGDDLAAAAAAAATFYCFAFAFDYRWKNLAGRLA